MLAKDEREVRLNVNLVGVSAVVTTAVENRFFRSCVQRTHETATDFKISRTTENIKAKGVKKPISYHGTQIGQRYKIYFFNNAQWCLRKHQGFVNIGMCFQ